MELPQIIIRNDADRDADMVWYFLHHPQSPQYAKYILRSHPAIESLTDDKEGLRNWVVNWHSEHEPEIQSFIIEQETYIKEKGERALTLLGSFMDFSWESGTIYTANISLLPFSPFEGNEFFYSVLENIAGSSKPGRSILLVAIHEISHFIFFRYLKHAAKSLGWALEQNAVYFLKEALTTAMMNLPEFRELFEVESHKGNPELWNIYIDNSPEPLLLVQWMEEQLGVMQKSGTIFSEWILQMIQKFHLAESEFSSRMKLWRAQGPALQSDANLLAEYRKVIDL